MKKTRMVLTVLLVFSLLGGMAALTGCGGGGGGGGKGTTASFSGTPTSGAAPLTVTFTDESTSEQTVESWSWDFGDGSSSTEKNPVHVYNAAGTYAVKITVTAQGGGSDTKTKTGYVTVTGSGSTQWSGFLLDQVVTPKNGNPGKIKTFAYQGEVSTFLVSENTDFTCQGEYLRKEEASILADKVDSSTDPLHPAVVATVNTTIQCYVVKVRGTATGSKSYPAWEEVTYWIPTDPGTAPLPQGMYYAKAEYQSSDGQHFTVSEFETKAMRDEEAGSPGITYQCHVDGADPMTALGKSLTVAMTSIYTGIMLSWQTSTTTILEMEPGTHDKTGNAALDAMVKSWTISRSLGDATVGSYSFKTSTTTWSGSSTSGGYSMVMTTGTATVTSDLALPIYVKADAPSFSTYMEFRLTGLTLQ